MLPTDRRSKEEKMKRFLVLWTGQFISAIGGGLTSFGLLVYVLYSYKDYVYCCAFAFSLIGMIVFYIIFAGIFGKWKVLAYCLCGFVLVNLYFCYDSTLILRRFHFQYKSNDQIIASVGLYCDVIDVAFNVLSLVNAK